MASRDDTLQQARATLSKGDAVEAARMCANLLLADPKDAEARHLNGRCRAALEKWSEAVAEFRQALQIRPGYLSAMVDLGVALASMGDYSEAHQLLKQARAQDARPATLHYALGLCLRGVGDLDGAARGFRDALERNPRLAAAQIGLGGVLLRMGQTPAAVTAFQRAAELRPQDAHVHADLGAAHLAAEDFSAAASAYRRAIELDPKLAAALLGLGMLAASRGEPSEARTWLTRGIELAPHDAAIALTAANALEHLGFVDEAFGILSQFAAANPASADIHEAMGALLLRGGRLEAAVASFDAALAVKADHADALVKRGNVLETLGRHADAIGSIERALAIRPLHEAALASLASCAFRICDWDRVDRAMAQLRGMPGGLDCLHPFLLLTADITPEEQARSLQSRGRRLRETPAPPVAARASRDALKVAYVSPDFRNHPVAHAIAGIIDRHDRDRVTPIAIALNAPEPSDVARRLRSSFDEFVDASAMSDAEVVHLMRQRGIDVAIDLAGHTVGARPRIFAKRAAPIQVNYLGFPASTGYEFMDYIIADDVVLPAADESLYTERVLRMPECYLPFDCGRLDGVQAVSRRDAGLPATGLVFCAFNNGYKITRSIFGVWMHLLRDVPGSILWLRGMGTAAADNLQAAAAAAGIAAERLVVAPYVQDAAQHIARLRLADLFLDTLPYNAHTSAAEALWAGVPLVTCRGRTFAGRVGASLAKAAGVPELVSADLAGYETLARELAHSPADLKAIRERLNGSRGTVALFDTDRYTRSLEGLLLAVSRRSNTATQSARLRCEH
jgi:protein O-GlcNAc transferase